MIRFASLLAAGFLAGLSAPGLAQDEAPALPPLDPAPRAAPLPAAATRLAYSAEDRAAWLDRCAAVYRDAATCTTYLARYEQAATDPFGAYGVQVVRTTADCPEGAVDAGDAYIAPEAIAPADDTAR